MASALARLFSGRKGKNGPALIQLGIQKLRKTEEKLKMKCELLKKKIAQELAAAKKAGVKNKRGNNPLHTQETRDVKY